MEGVPRIPMLGFPLRRAADTPDFRNNLKKFISQHYGESPEAYSEEISNLESLRASAIHVSRDFTGCAMLKKYFCQLNYLKSRFPFQEGSSIAPSFSWYDIHADTVHGWKDIDFEMSCILYNIGALHSDLGTKDGRVNADGMKTSCTHFQCAAWAFQHLKNDYYKFLSADLSSDVLSIMSNICLAQAQECILEKSLIDNRKSAITAKVSLQIVDYYQLTRKTIDAVLKKSSGHNDKVLKAVKKWRELVEVKIHYYSCLSYLYRGLSSEEQSKFGERITFFKAGMEKLTEAIKLTNSMDKTENSALIDTLNFTSDVIGTKLTSSEKENEFVYHEKVPELGSLDQDFKGVSLVKGIPFKFDDPEIAGPDIFARLVPMEAHEASSLYSEEKAKILRSYSAKVEEKNESLDRFLIAMQLDQLDIHSEDMKIPQALIDCCAALSVNPEAVKKLSSLMSKLSGMFHDVEHNIKEINELLKAEDVKEKEFQDIVGKRPPNNLLTELSREVKKYQHAHSVASESNQTLHEAMRVHVVNLQVLMKPLPEVLKHIPSISDIEEKDESAIGEMKRLRSKIDEMQKQRDSLLNQLRESILNDDITKSLVVKQDQTLEAVFEEELKKHEKITQILDQNLVAQDNIIRAVTETNATYAETRKATEEILKKRNKAINALLGSYDAYNELLIKCTQGVEFYTKLDANVTKLLQRVRSACKVQEEEREDRTNAILKTTAAASSQLTNNKMPKYSYAPTSNSPTISSNAGTTNLYPSTANNLYNNSNTNYPTVSSTSSTMPDMNSASNSMTMNDTSSSIDNSVLQQQYEKNLVLQQQYEKNLALQQEYENLQKLQQQMAKERSTTLHYHANGNNYNPSSLQYSTESTSTPNYNTTTPMSGHYGIGSTSVQYYAAGISSPAQTQQPQMYTSPSTAVSSTPTPQSYPTATASPVPASMASYSTPSQYVASSSVSNNTNPNVNMSQQQQQQLQHQQSYLTNSTVTPPYMVSTSLAPSMTSTYSNNYHVNVNNNTSNVSGIQLPHQQLQQQPYSSIPTVSATNDNMMSQNQMYPPTPSSQQNYSSNPASTPTPNPQQNYSSNPASTPTPNPQQNYSSNPASTPTPNPQQMPTTAPTSSSFAPIPSSAGQQQPEWVSNPNPLLQQYGQQYGLGQSSAVLSTPLYGNYPILQQSNQQVYGGGVSTAPKTLQDIQINQPYGQQLSSQQQYGTNLPTEQQQQPQSSMNYHTPVNNNMYIPNSSGYSNYTSTTTTPASNAWDSNTSGGYNTNISNIQQQHQQQLSSQNYGVNYPGYGTGGYNSINNYYGQQSNNVAPVSNFQSPYASQPQQQHTVQPPYENSSVETIYANQQQVYETASNQSHVSDDGAQLSSIHPQATMHPPPPPVPAPQSQIQMQKPPSTQQKVETVSNMDLLAGVDLHLPHQPLQPFSSSFTPNNYNTTTTTTNGEGQVESTNNIGDSKNKLEINSTDLNAVILPTSSSSSSPEVSASASPAHKTKLSPSNVTETNMTDEDNTDNQLSQTQLNTLPLKITENRKLSKPIVVDHLSDPALLEKFTYDVENLEHTVEGFYKKSLNGPTNLDMKWKEILDIQNTASIKMNISVARCYPMKNRFPDILPFDQTRVPLPCTKDDYINASFVKGISTSSIPYIATQAPIKNVTYSDFWSMIWEYHVELIVCIASDADLKEHIYWPLERGKDLTFGPLKISLQSKNVKPTFVERIFCITHRDVKQTRVAIHLQFTGWPGNAFPVDGPGPLLNFVNEVHSFFLQQRNLSRPIVIHCIAGVGKTGIFITLSAAIREIQNGKVFPDLTSIGGMASEQRKGILNDKEHLRFAYQSLLYYCQDLLMKRGILSARATFDEKLTPKATHTRHPSQDFLTEAIKKMVKTENSNGNSSQHEDSESDASVKTNSMPSTPNKKQDTAHCSSGRIFSDIPNNLTDVDVSTFQKGTSSKDVEGKRIDQFESRKGALAKNMNEMNADPLCSLDPLWTMKK